MLYFTPNNEKVGKDTVAWKTLTPLVFVENKLVAKGWPAWDSIGDGEPDRAEKAIALNAVERETGRPQRTPRFSCAQFWPTN